MTSGSCSKSAVTSSSRASVVWFPILFDITSLRGTVHSWCAQLREREPVRAWRGCGCKDWDVLIVGAGESLLGLHHLDGVCHAGSEAVFRPGEALIGKCDTLLGHFHLLFRGIQVDRFVEQCRPAPHRAPGRTECGHYAPAPAAPQYAS